MHHYFLEDSQTFIQAWGTDAASSSVGESLVVELFLAAFGATIITREMQRGLIKTFVCFLTFELSQSQSLLGV